jgi:hypothetical protein
MNATRTHSALAWAQLVPDVSSGLGRTALAGGMVLPLVLSTCLKWTLDLGMVRSRVSWRDDHDQEHHRFLTWVRLDARRPTTWWRWVTGLWLHGLGVAASTVMLLAAMKMGLESPDPDVTEMELDHVIETSSFLLSLFLFGSLQSVVGYVWIAWIWSRLQLRSLRVVRPEGASRPQGRDDCCGQPCCWILERRRPERMLAVIASVALQLACVIGLQDSVRLGTEAAWVSPSETRHIIGAWESACVVVAFCTAVGMCLARGVMVHWTPCIQTVARVILATAAPSALFFLSNMNVVWRLSPQTLIALHVGAREAELDTTPPVAGLLKNGNVLDRRDVLSVALAVTAMCLLGFMFLMLSLNHHQTDPAPLDSSFPPTDDRARPARATVAGVARSRGAPTTAPGTGTGAPTAPSTGSPTHIPSSPAVGGAPSVHPGRVAFVAPAAACWTGLEGMGSGSGSGTGTGPGPGAGERPSWMKLYEESEYRALCIELFDPESVARLLDADTRVLPWIRESLGPDSETVVYEDPTHRPQLSDWLGNPFLRSILRHDMQLAGRMAVFSVVRALQYANVLTCTDEYWLWIRSIWLAFFSRSPRSVYGLPGVHLGRVASPLPMVATTTSSSTDKSVAVTMYGLADCLDQVMARPSSQPVDVASLRILWAAVRVHLEVHVMWTQHAKRLNDTYSASLRRLLVARRLPAFYIDALYQPSSPPLPPPPPLPATDSPPASSRGDDSETVSVEVRAPVLFPRSLLSSSHPSVPPPLALPPPLSLSSLPAIPEIDSQFSPLLSMAASTFPPLTSPDPDEQPVSAAVPLTPLILSPPSPRSVGGLALAGPHEMGPASPVGAPTTASRMGAGAGVDVEVKVFPVRIQPLSHRVGTEWAPPDMAVATGSPPAPDDVVPVPVCRTRGSLFVATGSGETGAPGAAEAIIVDTRASGAAVPVPVPVPASSRSPSPSVEGPHELHPTPTIGVL